VGVVVQPVILAQEKIKQKDHKIEASLGNIVSSRPALA
jgi:hypothetical protein